MHVLTLSHVWLKLFIYIHQNFEINIFLSFSQKLQPHSLKVSAKRNLFQCNLDYINALSKSIKKTLYKPYIICIYKIEIEIEI